MHPGLTSEFMGFPLYHIGDETSIMGFDLESMETLRLTKQVHLHIQLYSLKLFIFIKGDWEHKVLSFLTLRNFCHLNISY